MTEKVLIRRLPTGVPGLDEVLGGGLPEFSFNQAMAWSTITSADGNLRNESRPSQE